MNLFIRKLIYIGQDESLSTNESKRVRLLNIFCLLAYLTSTISAIHYYYSTAFLLFYFQLFLLLCMIIIQYIQYNRYYILARILFWNVNFLAIFLFSFYLESPVYNEYYFSVLAILPLMFFDNKWIQYGGLLLSVLAFYSTGLYIIYTEGHISHPIDNGFLLFAILFLAVNYFKRTNEKNELILIAQRKELEELNKFQTHFLVNLSHEIRTPLTVIQGHSNQLNQLLTDPKLITFNKGVYRSSKKIQTLTDNIIDLAKMNVNKLELQLKITNPIHFCRQIISSFHPTFTQKNIQLSYVDNIISNNISVKIDTVYFERALNNLILNAYKYTQEKGIVSFSINITNNRFVVEITDNGCGIPQKDLPYIFDSFYRSKNSINQAGGSGIGLSFSKEVIQLHQGTIDVQSTLDKGSVFRVSLPLLTSKEKDDPTPTFSLEQNSLSSTSILLVEDNKDMREYLLTILSQYSVKAVTNGIEALESLNSHIPDLIITDYMMPQMDGYEFVTKAKENGIDKPIVVLTARMDQEGKLNFLRLGIDDYLTKPFNEEELMIRIKNCLNNYSKREVFLEEENIINPNNNQELVQIEELIKDNISSSFFGVPALSDGLKIPERSLYRKIKSMTGLTPNQLIREIKLTQAQKMCANKEVSTVKELANSLGFENSHHFVTLYKKRFGKKPL